MQLSGHGMDRDGLRDTDRIGVQVTLRIDGRCATRRARTSDRAALRAKERSTGEF